MYNYYQQQPNMFRVAGLKGHPVASLDEAKATTVDFDGSIFYFPDLANNKIYTKQINLDGTVSMNMYELKSLPQQLTTDYITREEFDSVVQKFSEIIDRLPKVESNVAMAAKSSQSQIQQDYTNKF